MSISNGDLVQIVFPGGDNDGRYGRVLNFDGKKKEVDVRLGVKNSVQVPLANVKVVCQPSPFWRVVLHIAGIGEVATFCAGSLRGRFCEHGNTNGTFVATDGAGRSYMIVDDQVSALIKTERVDQKTYDQWCDAVARNLAVPLVMRAAPTADAEVDQ